MKKQTQTIKSSDKPVTKKFFLKAILELKEFIRQIPEIRKEAKARDTTLDQKMDEGFRKAEARNFGIELKMEQGFREVDERAQQYRDNILNGLDKVVKELQDMREENAAGTLHLERIDVSLNDHEKRIKTLEHAKN